MVSVARYTEAIDLWSVGCILAEMFLRRPLFPARNYLEQINMILEYTGTPSEADFQSVVSNRAREYIRSYVLSHAPRCADCVTSSRVLTDAVMCLGQACTCTDRLPFRPPLNPAVLLPGVNPLALDLLDRLLQFNPQRRITAEQALAHPYLAAYHDPSDEPRAAPLGRDVFFFDYAKEPLSLEQLKGAAKRTTRMRPAGSKPHGRLTTFFVPHLTRLYGCPQSLFTKSCKPFRRRQLPICYRCISMYRAQSISCTVHSVNVHLRRCRPTLHAARPFGAHWTGSVRGHSSAAIAVHVVTFRVDGVQVVRKRIG